MSWGSERRIARQLAVRGVVGNALALLIARRLAYCYPALFGWDMKLSVGLSGCFAALALVGVASPASADMSACGSAFSTTDPAQKIFLYTVCIKHSGEGLTVTAIAYVYRGSVYAAQGDTDSALKDFASALELDPQVDAAYIMRGQTYANLGQWAKAQADFDHASAHYTTRNNRARAFGDAAWLLATCPDGTVRNGSKAVELALEGVRLKDGANTHDDLAAAYAEAGRFDDAVREESTAIGRVLREKDQSCLHDYQARLALYQNGMPYRPTLLFAKTAFGVREG